MNYNKKIVTVRKPTVKNLAGGKAYSESHLLELTSVLTTSFMYDGFYRQVGTWKNGVNLWDDREKFEANNTLIGKLNELFSKTNPYTLAQAVLFTRNVAGLRSVTHYAGAWMANNYRGYDWTRNFYNALFRRPDDMTETVAAYMAMYGDKLPNALKDGLRRAFGHFDAYQLAKYREEDKDIKLVDLVNLVHPHGTEKNGTVFVTTAQWNKIPTKSRAKLNYTRVSGGYEIEAVSALVLGLLKNTDTWEAKLSAGDDDTWGTLIRENRLGYLAALRNIRNVAKAYSDGKVDKRDWNAFLDILKDPNHNEKSLVFPHQIYNAYKTLMNEEIDRDNWSDVSGALETAALLSLTNMPVVANRSISALDVSGSMVSAKLNGFSKTSVAEIAGIFAVSLALRNGGVLYTFDTRARRIVLKNTNILAQTAKLPYNGGGTAFESIFDMAISERVAADVIFIASDMQSWIGETQSAYNRYARTLHVTPKVVGLDLAGYGTTQFHAGIYYGLAGFGSYNITLMGDLINNPDALIDRVKAVTF